MRKQWQALEKKSREEAEAAGVTIIAEFDRIPFEDAMTGVYAKAKQDPQLGALITRIRQVK
jgi:TRAP-type C4-dicarboxylate transport system substrate-binding protein